MSNRHSAVTCRACGCKLDDATCMTDDPETPLENGSFSVCIRCSIISVYDISVFGVALRPPTDAEMVEFQKDHGAMYLAVQAFTAQHTGGLL
jgi:hypothetical protein